MAVSQVILVLYQSDLGVQGGIVEHDARGAVGGAVVDDDDLPLIGELRECGDHFVEEPRDVGLLVKGGKKA